MGAVLSVKLARMKGPGSASGRSRNARASAKRRVTIMSAVVIVSSSFLAFLSTPSLDEACSLEATFAICWFPIHLIQALNAWAYPDRYSNSVHFIQFMMCAQVGSLLSPNPFP